MLRFLIDCWRVWTGRVQRICAPGRWIVWREGHAVLSKLRGRH
jgi:hypothetical protein